MGSTVDDEWEYVGRLIGQIGASRRTITRREAERHFWITGFQAEDGDAYVERQGGFWIHRQR